MRRRAPSTLAEARGDSPYFAAGAGFVYHQKDLTGIRDKEANYRTVVMVEDKPVVSTQWCGITF